MKPFTPSKIKADVIFAASLAAASGFNLPNSVSVALISGAAVIAAGLNFGEALIERFDPKLVTQITNAARAEIKAAVEAQTRPGTDRA
jgi:hypothetical protein